MSRLPLPPNVNDLGNTLPDTMAGDLGTRHDATAVPGGRPRDQNNAQPPSTGQRAEPRDIVEIPPQLIQAAESGQPRAGECAPRRFAQHGLDS
jgi:hypothetical protein